MVPFNSIPISLEGTTSDGSRWVVTVDHSPFSIGRRDGSSLLLTSGGVSRRHAEILDTTDGWVLRDCGSTNGTHVNGKRLAGDHLLRQGDQLRIADFRFDVVGFHEDGESTQVIDPYAELFEQMLEEKAFDPHFQPIISLADDTLVGYEFLGRINFPGLPNNPSKLFEIARRCDKHIELCQSFRDNALEHAASSKVQELVLFNTLPEEMNLATLSPYLKELRKSVPDLKLGMELHENAITDATMMKQLRQLLDELDILLVYDDFGAGQSRLVELLDFVPDIIKFDVALIRNIQNRTEASRSIVGTLVKMAKDAGIRTVAEGIENLAEADVCRTIGFELGQGFYLGRPARI